MGARSLTCSNNECCNELDLFHATCVRAGKKGHRYGTIVVDLEAQRVAALLPDRSVLSTKQWLSNHPEIQVVSRDRGKLFREAADEAAPQAQQVVDRFHLQKNFAEALEKFFRQKTRQLQKVAQ